MRASSDRFQTACSPLIFPRTMLEAILSTLFRIHAQLERFQQEHTQYLYEDLHCDMSASHDRRGHADDFVEGATQLYSKLNLAWVENGMWMYGLFHCVFYLSICLSTYSHTPIVLVNFIPLFSSLIRNYRCCQISPRSSSFLTSHKSMVYLIVRPECKGLHRKMSVKIVSFG